MRNEYGEEFAKINGFSDSQLNYTDFIDNFIDKGTVADATIDPNANASNKDVCSLMQEMNKSHLKLICYNKIYYEMKKKWGKDEADRWLEGDYLGKTYLHDASSSSMEPYCYAYDLTDLATKGLFFIRGFKSRPARHLTTFCDHFLEYTSWVSNRSSGAAGFPNFLVWAYYFWKKDCEDGFFLRSPEYYRDQCFQKVLFDLNQPYLRITQTTFSNFSIFDKKYCEDIFGGLIYPDGTCFIDEVENFIEFQKAFMTRFSELREENLFTYPVLTYALVYKDGKFVDEEFARWCSNHNIRWADSNFFINENTGTLSSCCRLLNDTTKLDGFINSIGGTALSIGSIKVNTINLMRIAYEAKDIDDYFRILKERVDICVKTLDTVRTIIARNVEKGLLPTYTNGLIDMTHQYCTIGINALYEATRYFGGVQQDEFGNSYYTEEGLAFAGKVLDTINELKDSYDVDYSFNIESIPAERAAVCFAQKDNILYHPKDPDYIYSNQWIALKDKASIQERARVSSVLDKKCGGGVILHINIDAPFKSEEQAWEMLNYIAQTGVIYFAFNLRINLCENGHSFTEKHCPMCGEAPVETYQRIVGYLVPTRAYSADRKREVMERKEYPMDVLLS